MKLRNFFIFSCIFSIFLSCKKDDTPELIQGGFHGALDSLAVGDLVADSGNLQYPTSVLKFAYDEQRRVTKEVSSFFFFSGETELVRFYYYDGNSPLPYMQIDSSLSPTGDAILSQHLFTYDNSNRVIRDSIYNYTRLMPSGNIWNSTVEKFTKYYHYRSNYMTSIKKLNDYCSDKDTLFFNTKGDIQKRYVNCFGIYDMKVDEYYPDLNPLSNLNIAPLFSSRDGSTQIQGDLHPIFLNIFQPKYLFKKISGINTTFNSHNDDDYVVVTFATTLNSENQVKDLVISNYVYYNDWDGSGVDTFHVNYRFFYHP